MTNLSADEVNGVQKYLEMANPHSDLGPTPLEAMLILDRFVSSADLVTFMYFSGSSSITKSSLSFSLLSMKMTKVKVPQMDMTTCSRDLDKLLHIFQSILTMSFFLKAQGHILSADSLQCTLHLAVCNCSFVIKILLSLPPCCCCCPRKPLPSARCLPLKLRYHALRKLFLTHHSPSSERRSSSLQL